MKQVILLCAVAIGGPTFDKKGAVDGSNEQLLPPGTVRSFEDAEADRLIALGAARVPVAEAPAEAPLTGGDAPAGNDTPAGA